MSGSVANGLQAALLLARGRPEAMQLVAGDSAGAARSFWAIAICVPAFICLRLLTWQDNGAPPHAGHALAIDLLFYGIGWLGFAVASHSLVRVLDRGPRWPQFIAAWNWCNVVQYLLLVAAAVPGILGAPSVIDQTAQLAAFGWALWLEWFAIRLALGITGRQAVAFVAFDVALGLFLDALAASLQLSWANGLSG